MTARDCSWQTGVCSLGAAAVLAVVLAASGAQAQIFSPGVLSKGHAQLEGLGSCTKCHVEGSQHDNRTCLECHKEIGRRMDAERGFHRTVQARKCAECHREHRGLNAKLIDWTPSREAFNHRLTGWPLEGAHKKPTCKTCHEARRIKDEDARVLLVDKGRETFLGLSTECVRCHFDEHRGQEGNECQRCHNQEGFRRAPKFNHNDRSSKFPLVGKHATVQCRSCHEPLVDTTTPAGAWPAPVDVVYMQLKDIPHASCIACHDDAHRGKFGKDCLRCHTPVGWQTIKEGAQDTGFHDKHAFPLRGAHQSVSCRSCHGPFPGQAAKFKGTKFARCADCHADAHVGQLRPEEGALRCESCHEVTGFLPVLFDVKLHESTRFPLEGAHRSVACNLCHKADAKVRERIPAAIKREIERRNRPLLVSAARLAMPDVVADALGDGKPAGPSDCNGCHADVHAGQFAKPAGTAPEPRVEKKACAACHATSSFAELTFKHDDSRFPLTGKHKGVACAACHTAARGKGAQPVAYRPLDLACASCHADEHVGQLARARGTDCSGCHVTTGFLPVKFDHDKQSVFPLDGRHQQVKCAACHRVVEVNGDKIARYKPVPTACTTCHDDEHKHAFDDFNPMVTAPSARRSRAATAKQETRCEGCHTPTAWTPSKFAHERTGFVLTGRHATNRCVTCHGNDTKRSLPATCAACHQDPHAQEFGLMCNSCHTTDSFGGPAFPVDAHRRSNFPLSGRHAGLPCDGCHVERRERTFTRAALDCISCHRNDAARASLTTIDHARAPIAGASCLACHVPAAFAPARFPQHEVCFPLARGSHAPVRCTECHTGLGGRTFNGSCVGVPVLCATCHVHAAEVENPRHSNVPGYEFKSEKCAGCHRGG